VHSPPPLSCDVYSPLPATNTIGHSNYIWLFLDGENSDLTALFLSKRWKIWNESKESIQLHHISSPLHRRTEADNSYIFVIIRCVLPLGAFDRTSWLSKSGWGILQYIYWEYDCKWHDIYWKLLWGIVGLSCRSVKSKVDRLINPLWNGAIEVCLDFHTPCTRRIELVSPWMTGIFCGGYS
jgi:hypothetical protein